MGVAWAHEVVSGLGLFLVGSFGDWVLGHAAITEMEKYVRYIN